MKTEVKKIVSIDFADPLPCMRWLHLVAGSSQSFKKQFKKKSFYILIISV